MQGGSGKRDDDGFYKWQSWTSARSGSISGTLSLSQFKADGFRQHSAAEFRQLNSGIDYTVCGSTLATLRLSLADDPTAQNPGALTLPEYTVNPDSAAASNIRRGADKDAQQYQLALGMRHFDATGTSTRPPSSGCCAIWPTHWPRRRSTVRHPPRVPMSPSIER